MIKKRLEILAARRAAVSKEIVNRLWIEMDEQKPEIDKLILVSLADGTVECAIYNGLTWSHPWDNDHVYEEVVAWQSLPDPYKKQEIE